MPWCFAASWKKLFSLLRLNWWWLRMLNFRQSELVFYDRTPSWTLLLGESPLSLSLPSLSLLSQSISLQFSFFVSLSTHRLLVSLSLFLSLSPPLPLSLSLSLSLWANFSNSGFRAMMSDLGPIHTHNTRIWILLTWMGVSTLYAWAQQLLQPVPNLHKSLHQQWQCQDSNPMIRGWICTVMDRVFGFGVLIHFLTGLFHSISILNQTCLFFSRVFSGFAVHLSQFQGEYGSMRALGWTSFNIIFASGFSPRVGKNSWYWGRKWTLLVIESNKYTRAARTFMWMNPFSYHWFDQVFKRLAFRPSPLLQLWLGFVRCLGLQFQFRWRVNAPESMVGHYPRSELTSTVLSCERCSHISWYLWRLSRACNSFTINKTCCKSEQLRSTENTSALGPRT